MTSNATSSSGSVARARAKAEAAKVRASYAAQEAKLKMEKAVREAETKLETTRIETELEVLSLQKEADAATVEAQIMEMAQTTLVSEVGEGKSERAHSERSKMERTQDYVHKQIELKSLSSSHHPSSQPAFHPPDKKSLESYRTKPLPNPEDSMHLPPPKLPDSPKNEIKSDVMRPYTYHICS